MVLDRKTGSNLLQWPVKEVEDLRLRSNEFKNVKAEPGSVVPLNIEAATQVCFIPYQNCHAVSFIFCFCNKANA